MTKDELKRVMVIEKWIDDHLTEQDVARNLGISVRQAYRLKAKYRNGGAQAIAHGNRGRKPAHTLADSLKQRVQHLYQGRYFGSNSTHFAELLAEHEDIRDHTPEAEAAKDYIAAVRSLLLEDGNPSLDLPGIRIYENAQAIQASLQRCLDKKGDFVAEKRYQNIQ